MEIFYIAVAMAFIPTLMLMYVMLRPYTYPATEYPYFSDPSFFILFAVGLVAGTIMFLVFSYIMGNILAMIVYALIQVMAVVVCMNLKRYRGKSDSIFYGYGFGLGAGATTGTGLIYWIANSADRLGGALGAGDYAILLILSLSMILQFSSVGVTVGDGIARHIPMQYAVQAMIYNVIFWAVFWIALYNVDNFTYFLLASLMCLAVSAGYLMYAFKREVVLMVKEVDRMNAKGKKNRS